MMIYTATNMNSNRNIYSRSPVHTSGNRMNRKSAERKLRFMMTVTVVIVCLALGSLVLLISGDKTVQAAAVEQTAKVVVLPGDTLWSISERYAPEGGDIRAYIGKVKEANGLTSGVLQAGQILIMPK